jgi:hypothetical protein
MSRLAYCTAIELQSTADTQKEPAVSGNVTVLFNLLNFAYAIALITALCVDELVSASLHAAYVHHRSCMYYC